MRCRHVFSVAMTAVMTVALATSPLSAADKDIVDTAVEAGSFNTLAAALGAADLVSALKQPGPFTVFAPTDAAFAKLPPGIVEDLLKPENKQKLISVLTYHVAAGKFTAAQAVGAGSAKSLNGQQIDIKVKDGRVNIDDAAVTANDIVCSNGVIHVIDSVILPAGDNIPTTASNAGIFGTLLAAAQAADLVGALSGDGPLTVFAPTDAAFASLPAGTVESLLEPGNKAKLASILKYHVVAGRVYAKDALAAGSAATLQGTSVSIVTTANGATVNGANLVQTDVDASNGVIHIIDKVLIPGTAPAAAVAMQANRIVMLDPRTTILNAIDQGAPMFNAGHKAQCAAIYMRAAESLLARPNHGMSAAVANNLTNALANSRHMSSADSQSWTMRYALDMALNHMGR